MRFCYEYTGHLRVLSTGSFTSYGYRAVDDEDTKAMQSSYSWGLRVIDPYAMAMTTHRCILASALMWFPESSWGPHCPWATPLIHALELPPEQDCSRATLPMSHWRVFQDCLPPVVAWGFYCCRYYHSIRMGNKSLRIYVNISFRVTPSTLAHYYHRLS